MEAARQQIAMVGVVAMQWCVVATAPFLALGKLGTFSRFEGWALTLMAAVVGYCFYTGYRAWRRGWKARFVLRLVVPASLFVLSCIAAALGWWSW
jgi:hypothetical protein